MTTAYPLQWRKAGRGLPLRIAKMVVVVSNLGKLLKLIRLGGKNISA